MFDLPNKCYVNKFLPKKIFYEKVGVSSSVRDEFVNLVDRITWLYKLAQDTVGIGKTENIEEIQIFQLDIKEKKIPYSVIKAITKGIPYKILFVLKFSEDVCYAIKVDDIYVSDWNRKIEFNFNALNLEIVYQNIVKCVIGEEDNKEDFENIIEERNIKIELEKRINSLKAKIKNEKQFNRKVELNNDLNKLLNELEEINNG